MSKTVTLADSSPETKADLGALVFYSEFDDPGEWSAALKRHLPDLDFRVYPDVGDVRDIRYALVWRPPAGFFQPFPNLKLVVNLGAGVDSLTGRTDLPDVPICRLSDSGMVAMMRSYVLFAVIRYARDMPSFEEAKRRKEWLYIHPRPLHTTRVGVLGLGALGSAVAEGLASVGFDVRGWDRAEKVIPGVRCYSDPADWTSFLAELDILVNMMPLTPATRGLIGAEVFDALPRGAKFVNASRGEVVDEPALIAALRSGQIGGATLDVFAVEPLPAGHPFWDMENVFITPHLASITVPESAAGDVAESIRRIEGGQQPLHRINPRLGY
jgi:glyoxylate/hydroxypyruvate reductase A